MNSLAIRRYAGAMGLLLLIFALVAVAGLPASAGGDGNNPPSTASTTSVCTGELSVVNAIISFDAGASTAQVTFDTTQGCERTVTFALYRKLCDYPEFCLPQQLDSYLTQVVQPEQSYSWQLTVPATCDRWQVDLAYGDVIQDLSTGTYGSRLITTTFLNLGRCEVTTTTTAPTTTTTAPTTTTTAPTTTTTAPTTTTGSTPNDTPEVQETEVEGVEVEGAEVLVAGIQATAPGVQAQVGTDTLPFTGASTGSMVGLGAALAAGGAILLAASRRAEEKGTKRSWN